MILLVGATGELGSRIAERLRDRGSPLRALVRPGSDASKLEALGVEIARGDLRDSASVRTALTGVETVVTTVTAISRALGGEHTATIRDVDGRGNATLVAAAESAGVQRFVFMSFAQSPVTLKSPLGAAKRSTEERIARTSMRGVIVKPELFSEIWISKAVGFDWEEGKAQIFGRGETPNAYVAIDDVAEAVARLALDDDPPRDVAFGGPDPLTRKQVVRLVEQATGRSIKVRHVPRPMLRMGSVALRRLKPVQASLMALALHADTEPSSSAQALHDLGIEPRTVGSYIEELGRRGA